MTEYEQKIVNAFRALCAEQGGAASPHEVTERMAKRGELTSMDTVIDIEKLMKGLRNRGVL
ncbi:MAG: hypothetical protein A2Y38_17350 [Spirochaetes bacterium GWB1_59_5]|nr:MAG: hypothetical protein A2Y38_17350 [Spirochaetes bacterium GWB1_59_5]